MNYLQFREQWLGLGCFSIYQLRAWRSDLDSSSLSRWVKRGYLVAEPEKAIIDLLYLYPQYNTADAMLDLRFDIWWMQEELDKEKIMAYAKQTAKKTLIDRIELLLKTYDND